VTDSVSLTMSELLVFSGWCALWVRGSSVCLGSSAAVGMRALVEKKFSGMQECSAMSDSWNCVVVCRRLRAGIDEVLVQWECSWVDADEVAPGKVVAVLLRRTVRGQNQMLVQWACTWEPVGQVDAGAVEEYDGDVIVEATEQSAVEAQVLDAGAATSATAPKRRRVKRRNW
jgi:hypothetical protein